MATEVAQEAGVSQNLGGEGSPSTATDTVAQAAVTPAVTPQEKLLPQSKVNEIVQREKRDAYEKGRREAGSAETPNTTHSTATNMGGMSQITDERIRQLAAEAAQTQYQNLLNEHKKNADMTEAQRIANEFMGKMESAKTRYSDFDQVVGQLEYREIPHIVHLANTADNTADVMYELASNPSKIATLTMLLQTSPKLAQMEMAKLSHSIKSNLEATKTKTAAEPLSQLPHSAVGTDTGSLTVRDLKKQSWLRG